MSRMVGRKGHDVALGTVDPLTGDDRVLGLAGVSNVPERLPGLLFENVFKFCTRGEKSHEQQISPDTGSREKRRAGFAIHTLLTEGIHRSRRTKQDAC